VVTWYLQVGQRIPFLGEIRFELIYGMILGVFVLLKTDFSRSPTPLLKYVILLFLCMIIQIPFSHDIYMSKAIFTDRVLKFSVMAIFISVFIRNPRHLIFFLCAFFLACLKMGQEGFIGNLSGRMIWENQGVMRLHGSTSLYAHPNSFAGMALGTVPFIYYFFPISPRWIKAVLVVMLGFAINIIIFTGSRTGYVAFIIFALFVILKSKVKKKAIACVFVIGIISMPLIPQDYIDRFHTIFTGVEKEGRSAETRKQILKDAWQIFIENPLGVGVAAFPAARMAKFGRFQDTHNLYLEIATNLGIQGLLVFGLFIFNMLKMLTGITRGAYKQIQEMIEVTSHAENKGGLTGDIKKHISDLRLIYATGSAVFMFIIVRLALGLFGMDLYEIYWWFAFGLTVALYNIKKYSDNKTNEILNLI